MSTEAPMLFMSPEHVAAMNQVLARDEAIRQACAELDEPRVLAFRLSDGPGGADVHWTITFDGTLRFSLDEYSSPDILITGDWRRMIRATEAGRRGAAIDPGVEVHGDPALLAQLMEIFELGRKVATFDVRFPDDAG
jgi:hypothetical protein